MSVNPNEYLEEEFVRNPLTQKHRTSYGGDSTNNSLNKKIYEPERYHLATVFFCVILKMTEKKMFTALALVEKFIKKYEENKAINDENSKKIH